MYGRRPLTRLEAGLYSALIGIAITFFAWQMLDYMEIAERAAMNATLSNVSSALNTRAAQELFGSRRPAADWTRGNPFEIARVIAPNYVGRIDAAGVGSLPSASWAFDETRGELIYTPRLHFNLRGGDPQQVLRFRLMPSPRGIGYVLEPTAAYRWE
jgi:hypothetical protein